MSTWHLFRYTQIQRWAGTNNISFATVQDSLYFGSEINKFECIKIPGISLSTGLMLDCYGDEFNEFGKLSSRPRIMITERQDQ